MPIKNIWKGGKRFCESSPNLIAVALQIDEERTLGKEVRYTGHFIVDDRGGEYRQDQYWFEAVWQGDGRWKIRGHNVLFIAASRFSSRPDENTAIQRFIIEKLGEHRAKPALEVAQQVPPAVSSAPTSLPCAPPAKEAKLTWLLAELEIAERHMTRVIAEIRQLVAAQAPAPDSTG